MFKYGASISAATFIADQWSKWAILNVVELDRKQVVPITDFLNLRMAWNPGVSFGMFATDGPLGRYALIAFAMTIVLFLVFWMARATNMLVTVAIGLLIGGAVGNIYDRIIYGAVVDFLDFHAFDFHFWTFNIADTAISVGVMLLIYDSFFGAERAEKPA